MSQPDVFISYKRQDQDTARHLATALSATGYQVWWDPALRAGEHFDQVIEQALADSRCVIVLWSPLSVQSQYVRDEASYALEHNKLVPVWVDEVELPFRFRGLHTLNFTGWAGETGAPVFAELIDDISARIGPPGDPKDLPLDPGGTITAPPWRKPVLVASVVLALALVGGALLWLGRNGPPRDDCLMTIAIEALGHEREALTIVARGGDWTRSFPVAGDQTTIEIPAAYTNEWEIDVVWDGAMRSRFGGDGGFSGCVALGGARSDDGSAQISMAPL